MGLILGPIKGVFLCLISDLFTQLIKGIALWMWQYQLINIGIVLVSSFFIHVIELKDKKWLFTNLFSAILVFLAFYVTTTVIMIFPDYHKLTRVIFISVFVISIITLIIYISLFIYYWKTKIAWAKNLIAFFTLSTLLLIIFSWIFGPIAHIAYLNRLSPGSKYSIANYTIFLVPRIIKAFFEIPIYTILIYAVYDLLINKLGYKNTYRNKYI
jgi:hypothetical protein